VIGGVSDIQEADNPYPNSKLGIDQASLYTPMHRRIFSYPKEHYHDNSN
jgi:hypothetical protein